MSLRHSIIPLLLLLGAGLALRLAFAPTVENGDAVITQGWMQSAVQLGIAPSYDRNITGGMLPLYPPFSIFLFQAAGFAYQWLISPEYALVQPAHLVFVKMPAILADLAIGFLLFLILARWKTPAWGLGAAALFWFHPVALFNSVIWGQTDAIYTLLVLAGCFLAARGAPVLGLLCTVLACLTKPQAVAFLPLSLALLPVRPRALVGAAAGSAAVVLLLVFPFLREGNLGSMLRAYEVFEALKESRVSWNAYNLWWLLLGVDAATHTPGSATLLGPLTYRMAGLLLWGGTTLATILLLSPALRGPDDERRSAAILLAGTIIAWSFFLLNAEMHERYLFPFVALGLPLALRSRWFFPVYFLVSLLHLLNLLAVFPYSSVDRWIFSIPYLHMGIAAAQVLLFLLTILLLALPRTRSALLPPPPPAERHPLGSFLHPWYARQRFPLSIHSSR